MSTAVYLDQIRQLVELQKVDDAIFAVRQELESAPASWTSCRPNSMPATPSANASWKS